MKLVRTHSGEIGLVVELPAGLHVVDLASSLGVFAAHDPASGALINGALKERSAWGALVGNWRVLRKPLALLARTAMANPGDPRIAVQPFADIRQDGESGPGIVALDITDAADLERHDPTGRLVMARQFADPAEADKSSLPENVQVIDFSRRNDSQA